MDGRVKQLEKRLRLKQASNSNINHYHHNNNQVELDEQKSNVDDLYKLLLLTPSASVSQLNTTTTTAQHRNSTESPDSVRHAILAKNIREFSASKSMEISQHIQPMGIFTFI